MVGPSAHRPACQPLGWSWDFPTYSSTCRCRTMSTVLATAIDCLYCTCVTIFHLYLLHSSIHLALIPTWVLCKTLPWDTERSQAWLFPSRLHTLCFSQNQQRRPQVQWNVRGVSGDPSGRFLGLPLTNYHKLNSLKQKFTSTILQGSSLELRL